MWISPQIPSCSALLRRTQVSRETVSSFTIGVLSPFKDVVVGLSRFCVQLPATLDRSALREEGAEKNHIYVTAGNRAAAADGKMLKLKAARETPRLMGATTLPLCERNLFILAATPTSAHNWKAGKKNLRPRQSNEHFSARRTERAPWTWKRAICA